MTSITQNTCQISLKIQNFISARYAQLSQDDEINFFKTSESRGALGSTGS